MINKYIVPPIPTIKIRCKLHMNMNNHNLTLCFKKSCKSTTACETCADVVTLLSKPLGGSLDVNASVASQTPEDFTAHPKMHPFDSGS